MDLSLTEEQEMLKKMARDFLSSESPKSFVREMEGDERGYTPELWKKMAELGWMGLVIPEKYGGVGGSFLDLAILLEEMGRALLPGPFFPTGVLSSLLISEAGSEEQKEDILVKLANGELISTLALTEADGEYAAASINTEASLDGDEYVIKGSKLFVSDAHVSDLMICVTRTTKDVSPEEGISLFLVESKSPGVSCTALRTLAKDKQYEVILDQVRVPKNRVLGELNKGWFYIEKILTTAIVAKSIEMLGSAQQILEMTAEYTKERVQFGHPIGSYQAIQHHCANMLIDVDGLRFLAYKTAWMISQGIPCLKEAYMTKAWAGDACRRVVNLGTQVHGGLGIMKEHDVQLYFRRIVGAELLLGSADFCRERVSQEIFA